MLTVQGCRGLRCRLCLIPMCLSNARSRYVWVRLISQLHCFWKIRDLCFKETSPPNAQQICQLEQMLLFLFLPFHFWDAMSPHCQWRNKYCTWSLSVALAHSESRLRSCVVEGYKCVTHQRAPDSAWQSSTQEAYISSPRLELDLRWPWPSLFPRVQTPPHTLQY